MAIKPAAHPAARASNTNYVGGLRPGTATKLAHPNAADGWQVGQKPPAQAQNAYDNSTDLHNLWVDEGSSDALEEAHIKEADINGTMSCAGIVAGETASNANGITVEPNSGSGLTGLFCSTGSGKPGAILRQTDRLVSGTILRSQVASGASGVACVTFENTVTNGTRLVTIDADSDDETAVVATQSGFASILDITAGDGVDGVADGQAGVLLQSGQTNGANEGGPALRCVSTSTDSKIVEITTVNAAANGDALTITAQNRAHCLVTNKIGGRVAGIRASSSNTGTADQAAPLQLLPQTFDPGGEGFDDGSVYVKTLDFGGSPTDVPKVVVGGQMRSVMLARGPMCGLYEEIANTTVVSDGLADTLISQAFESKFEAIDDGPVHVSFKFWAKRTTNTSSIEYINIEISDDAGGGGTIFDENLDLRALLNAGAGSAENTWATQLEARARYTIPAAGARLFTVRATVPAAFTGDCALSQMLFEVRPVWN